MCQKCKECKECEEIGFEKGDVIQFNHGDEKLTLRLETENMTYFVNSTIEFEQQWLEDFNDVMGRKKSLDAMNRAIRKEAKEQAIVDSIIQHCLTGK